MSLRFTIKKRQLRPQYDAAEISRIAGEMVAKAHQGLKVEKQRLSLKSLNFLHEFCHLRGLAIYGVARDIQVVGELTELRELALCSLSTKDLSFTKDLPHLRHLWLQGLRLKDWASVGDLTQVKALTLFNMRALDSLDFLSNMTALQYLEIARCKGIQKFPDCSRLGRLRRVVLDDTNGLTSLAGLAKAPALRHLVVGGAKSLPTDCFTCFEGHPTVEGILPGVAPMNTDHYLDTCYALPAGLMMYGYYGTPNARFELDEDLT